jgi:hypothetical protein
MYTRNIGSIHFLLTMKTLLLNCVLFFCVATLILGGIFSFLLVAYFLIFILLEAWVFILEFAFPSSFLMGMEFGLKGFYTFTLLLAVFRNSYVNIKIVEIRYSAYYLRCFKTPEQGVRIWLNFRFYLGVLAGILLTIFSLSSLFNLCLSDWALPSTDIDIDPPIYVGYYLQEMQQELAKQIASTAVLTVLSALCSLFGFRYRRLVFLQALLLVTVAGALRMANYFQIMDVSMLGFVNSFLIASILAFILCFIDDFINNFINNFTNNSGVCIPGKKSFHKAIKKGGVKQIIRILRVIHSDRGIIESLLDKYALNFGQKNLPVEKKQYMLSNTAF